MVERRSRQRKRIVVFIDEDWRTCDRVARRLEAHGYHVLTAESSVQGMELVRVRRPDAVVSSEGADDAWAVCHVVRSHLPPQTPLVLRCSAPSPDRDSEAKARDLGVALVHKSSDPGQLGMVLDGLFQEKATTERKH